MSLETTDARAAIMIQSFRTIRQIAIAAIALSQFGYPLYAQTADPNDFPTYPELGPYYQNFFADVCGKKKVETNPSTFPFIGCFAIKAGGSLDGTIEGHAVSIRFDTNGRKTWIVDAVEVRRVSGSETNHPLVKPSGSGYAFCRNTSPLDCPVSIDLLMESTGEFATFDVSRMISAYASVTNQENWDDKELRKNYGGH